MIASNLSVDHSIIASVISWYLSTKSYISTERAPAFAGITFMTVLSIGCEPIRCSAQGHVTGYIQ